MLNAIQMGIFTPSTKQRLEELEQQRKDLSLQVAKEELAQPTLTRDQILFWLYRFRELNPEKTEHRPYLINSFVNAVYLYDDYLVFVGNYKDGTKTISFAELEAAGIGSDLNALSVPKKKREHLLSLLFYLQRKGLEQSNATVRWTVAHARLDGHNTFVAVHSRTATQSSPFRRTRKSPEILKMNCSPSSGQ